MSERYARRRRPPSLFWPLVLIGVGIIFLMVNFGYLQVDNVWAVLSRFWPAALILVGIDVLFGSRSTIGAIFSAILGIGLIAGLIALVWFAPQIPALRDLDTHVEMRTEQVSQPLEGVELARIVVDTGAASLTIGELEGSLNLLEAEISHYGDLKFESRPRASRTEVKLDVERTNPITWFQDERETWDIGLSSDVPLEIDVDSGSGSSDLDLRGLEVKEVTLNQGSGRATLELPSEGDVECKIDLGSGTIEISIPENMGAHIRLDKGSGSFQAASRFTLQSGRENGDGTWETAGYDDAEDRVTIDIDMGSGSVRID